MSSMSALLRIDDIAVRRVGRGLTLVCLFTVSVFAMQPKTASVYVGMEDKVEHLLAFTVLGIGFFSFWLQPARFFVVLLIGYGMLIEMLQAFIPGRDACVEDVVADAIGILLALFAVLVAKVGSARLTAWRTGGEPVSS